MSHRAHLFSLRIAHAIRESFITRRYSPSDLSKDILSGISVGIIATALALAITSGVPAQYAFLYP